ncbi:Na/Pi cotransporter family protein [Candidatus Bathyarchaeota archaeon]|nr:Na/Pi cotransporter family protein [Candidatus Bathyarchaeota archaeon]
MPRSAYRNALYTAVGLYFFLASIVLIKSSATLFGESLAEQILRLVHDTTGGVFAGWISTALLHSSGAFDSIVVAFTSAGILPMKLSVAAIIGAEIGTTVTPQLISVLGYIRKKGEEFSSSFRVTMMHFWYNLFTLMIFYPLELFTGLLTRIAQGGSSFFSKVPGLRTIPSLLDLITPWIRPLLQHIPPWAGLIGGVCVLMSSLMLAERSMTATFSMPRSWNLIRATFTKPLRSFLAGFIFTIFVPSTTVMVSLLVPLAASGVIGADYYILPYVLGANIGTVFDVMTAALATGDPVAIGVWLVHLSINLIGAAIFFPLLRSFGVFVGRATRYLTSHRLRAVVFLSVFHVIPVLVIVIGML